MGAAGIRMRNSCR
jgi:hypothetical protein